MTAGPLRVAVIGCGYFAQNHLYAWRSIPEASLVAVCDTDPERAEHSARVHGVPHWYTSVDELLRSEQVDIADVVTQADTHLSLVERLALDVRGIICQKPFAPDLEQARRMVSCCEQLGVRLTVHENFRFQGALRAAKTLSGELGRLFFARIHFRSAHDVYAAQPYLAQEERFILSDVGVHLFDLARFYLGEVGSVHCHAQRVNPAIQGEDVATALLVMESGATCVVDMSYASLLAEEYFPQTQVLIEGELGSVTVGGDYRVTFVRREQGTQTVRDEVIAPALHAWTQAPGEAVQDSVLALQRHYVNAWLCSQDPEVSARDNLETLRVTFAAYDSAATGLPVALGPVTSPPVDSSA